MDFLSNLQQSETNALELLRRSAKKLDQVKTGATVVADPPKAKANVKKPDPPKMKRVERSVKPKQTITADMPIQPKQQNQFREKLADLEVNVDLHLQQMDSISKKFMDFHKKAMINNGSLVQEQQNQMQQIMERQVDNIYQIQQRQLQNHLNQLKRQKELINEVSNENFEPPMEFTTSKERQGIPLSSIVPPAVLRTQKPSYKKLETLSAEIRQIKESISDLTKSIKTRPDSVPFQELEPIPIPSIPKINLETYDYISIESLLKDYRNLEDSFKDLKPSLPVRNLAGQTAELNSAKIDTKPKAPSTDPSWTKNVSRPVAISRSKSPVRKLTTKTGTTPIPPRFDPIKVSEKTRSTIEAKPAASKPSQSSTRRNLAPEASKTIFLRRTTVRPSSLSFLRPVETNDMQTMELEPSKVVVESDNVEKKKMIDKSIETAPIDAGPAKKEVVDQSTHITPEQSAVELVANIATQYSDKEEVSVHESTENEILVTGSNPIGTKEDSTPGPALPQIPLEKRLAEWIKSEVLLKLKSLEAEQIKSNHVFKEPLVDEPPKSGASSVSFSPVAKVDRATSAERSGTTPDLSLKEESLDLNRTSIITPEITINETLPMNSVVFSDLANVSIITPEISHGPINLPTISTEITSISESLILKQVGSPGDGYPLFDESQPSGFASSLKDESQHDETTTEPIFSTTEEIQEIAKSSLLEQIEVTQNSQKDVSDSKEKDGVSLNSEDLNQIISKIEDFVVPSLTFSITHEALMELKQEEFMKIRAKWEERSKPNFGDISLVKIVDTEEDDERNDSVTTPTEKISSQSSALEGERDAMVKPVAESPRLESVAEMLTTESSALPYSGDTSTSQATPSLSLTEDHSSMMSVTMSSLPTLSEGEILTQFYSQGEVPARTTAPILPITAKIIDLSSSSSGKTTSGSNSSGIMKDILAVSFDTSQLEATDLSSGQIIENPPNKD